MSHATYVIAGGTGLIGRALAQRWLANGHRVVILTRQQNAVLPTGAEAVRWDGQHDGAWRDCLDGARAVVNLCGENIGARRWTTARKRQLIDSRTGPTAALVAALRGRATPPMLVQASGVGYYGSSESATFTERDRPGDDFLARLSCDWEAAAAPAAAATRLVMVRLGVVLARDAGAFARLVLPFRIGVGGPLGNGRQWLSWIHIDDAVRALDFLTLRDDLTGPFNCTAPLPLTNRDAARSIGRTLRRPALVTLPRFVLTTLLGELATLVCDGQRVLPERLGAAGFEFAYPDFDAAAAHLLRNAR